MVGSSPLLSSRPQYLTMIRNAHAYEENAGTPIADNTDAHILIGVKSFYSRFTNTSSESGENKCMKKKNKVSFRAHKSDTYSW